MTTNQQLELGFNGTQSRIFSGRYESRVAHGKWWFARMREAVASAMEWQTDNIARPQPIAMTDAKGEFNV